MHVRNAIGERVYGQLCLNRLELGRCNDACGCEVLQLVLDRVEAARYGCWVAAHGGGLRGVNVGLRG